MINSNTEKWKSTGLLDGLQENQLDEMAGILETLARWIVTNCPEKGTPEYEVRERFCNLLTVARKLYVEIYPKKLPEPKVMIEDFSNFMKSHEDLLQALIETSYTALDAETEFADIYCKDFKTRFNL